MVVHKRLIFQILPVGTLRRFLSASGNGVAKNEMSNLFQKTPSSNLPVPTELKPPNYRRFKVVNQENQILNEEFMNRADASGQGVRLSDYIEMGSIVRSLPTITEKIRFVNPYERPWTRAEKRWHRLWLPKLFATRKAWNVCTVPRYFDCLDFYKYLTKTVVKHGLSQQYEGIVISTKKFEASLAEAIVHHMEINQDNEEAFVDSVLRSIVDCALQCLSSAGDVRDYRVTYSSRYESFWIRSGFSHMYETKQIGETCRQDPFRVRKFIGDDRLKLGELAFVVRDKFSVQLRRKEPLNLLLPMESDGMNDPLFDGDRTLKDILLSPKVYGMWPDKEPLWQCPGFEPDSGDQYLYGQVAFQNFHALNALCSYWNVHGEEKSAVRRDCFNAGALAALFSLLNGQAHALGFTQYNDIEKPIVSQLVLSDGIDFFFVVGQLNTIAINIDVEGFTNEKTNICYVDGPLKLYDRYDKETGSFYYVKDNTEIIGFNPRVLSRILQMFVKR